MNKAIFLDRDGVINHPRIVDGKPYPPLSLDDFKIIDGVEKALNLLHDVGYYLIVVTNQPDVARGDISKDKVELIHSFLKSNFPIDEIKSCYHDDSDHCECRKPNPGNILKAAEKYNIDLKNSYMIGDRWRDIEAGISAGCKTIFIDYHYKEKQPVTYSYKVSDLLEAAELILGDIQYGKN
jgi:D-glycero-D-manno-heptose 1,7-bisphosphate phosphatase